MENETPKPGSPAAVEMGCLCPVIDNNHGEGIPVSDGKGGTVFAHWVEWSCPMHGAKEIPEA